MSTEERLLNIKEKYGWQDEGDIHKEMNWLISTLSLFIQADKLCAELMEEMLQELKPYAQARRDTTKGKGWEWYYIEIKHDSDYEYYPNHIDKKVIEDFESRIAKRNKILKGE